MENIDNIIFDLGGVIITLDMPEAEKQFVSLGVKNYNELFRNGNVSSFFHDYEVGRINDTEFLAALRNLAGVDLTDHALITAWNSMLGIFPKERVELIKQLKQKYRLFLFSNTNALHTQAFRKIYAESFDNEVFDSLFEKAYYSQELGMRKPDTAPFLQIVADNKLDASRTAFIDDNQANAEAATKAGLHGIHLKPGTTILDLGL